MPSGMITIDARRTFAAMLLMSVSEKMQFGTQIPETTKDGERKYTSSAPSPTRLRTACAPCPRSSA